MFIGHYGAGFAVKKLKQKTSVRKPSLGTYFLAAQFLDVLWPIFILSGIEKIELEPAGKAFQTLRFIYYPFSHSLLSTIIWAVLFGFVYFLLKKELRYSILLGLVVISHWILDLISHLPDLQLIPGWDFKAGFGLWNSVPYTVIVEGLIFLGGACLYFTSTKAANKKGSILFWTLIIFLSVIYVLSIMGPPPTSVNAVAASGFAQWLIIGWGYWIDKNRIDLS